MAKTQAERPDTSALDAIRAAAEAGDAAAQLDLANRHHFGDGVPRDPEAAYRWMRRAAEAGVAEAQSKVGFFLTCGLGVPADPKGAIRWFLRGARGGYAKAAYNLGDAFWKGRHVTRSPRRAWFFFSKAVALGQEAGHYGLAALCYRGLGVPKDKKKAMDHLRRALRGGDTESIVEMGRLFRAGDASPKDLAEAEARAFALHQPGNPDSLEVLFSLRRETCAAPPRPPGLDAMIEEAARQQAIGREPDPPELDETGLAALREKAGPGDAEAGYLLGRVLLRREASDADEALEHLLSAAAAGHVAAAFQAGTLLYHGWGVPQDVARSLALLESSAASGGADAARFLALAYDGFGRSVPKDREIAMRWWLEGARLGDRHACSVVSRLLRKEDATPGVRARGLRERALPVLRLGALRGNHDTARYLVKTLRELGGWWHFQEAAYWLRESVRRDAASARMLGQLYWQGLGVPQSHATGTAWLALAREKGDQEAAILLASAFLEGLGVPQDTAAAFDLAESAAAAGHGQGARLLGSIYESGPGVLDDGGRAAAWFQRGAELGDAPSMFFLANILFDGRGVEPDLERAVEWLEKAAEADDAHAAHLLALMSFRGEGTPPDTARARGAFLRAVVARHIPSLFTTVEEEALRYRPAAVRQRDLRRAIWSMDTEPEVLPASSALELGLLYWNADSGLSQDRDRAAKALRASASKGNALAAACLSHVLRLAGDDRELEWLEKAARAGLPGAQRHLAFRLVETGNATWEDARVLRLIESAADQGDGPACFWLVRLLRDAIAPADADRAERLLALERCAVEGGYPLEALNGN